MKACSSKKPYTRKVEEFKWSGGIEMVNFGDRMNGCVDVECGDELWVWAMDNEWGTHNECWTRMREFHESSNNAVPLLHCVLVHTRESQ